jgi:hypothetical protein
LFLVGLLTAVCRVVRKLMVGARSDADRRYVVTVTAVFAEEEKERGGYHRTA